MLKGPIAFPPQIKKLRKTKQPKKKKRRKAPPVEELPIFIASSASAEPTTESEPEPEYEPVVESVPESVVATQPAPEPSNFLGACCAAGVEADSEDAAGAGID